MNSRARVTVSPNPGMSCSRYTKTVMPMIAYVTMGRPDDDADTARGRDHWRSALRCAGDWAFC